MRPDPLADGGARVDEVIAARPGTLRLQQSSVIAANNATTGAGIFVVSGGTVTFANGCAAHVKATNV
ncbi:MAG: hypothetical protein ACKOTZ_05495, partial [Chloroflexota bacterium]